MRMRDGVFLLAGAALGAVIVAALVERSPVETSGSPAPLRAPAAATARPVGPSVAPAPPPPAPSPATAPPVEEAPAAEEAERNAVRKLAMETLELQLAIERLLADPKGAGSRKPGAGYPGNPHAKMSLESLQADREKEA